MEKKVWRKPEIFQLDIMHQEFKVKVSKQLFRL